MSRLFMFFAVMNLDLECEICKPQKKMKKIFPLILLIYRMNVFECEKIVQNYCKNVWRERKNAYLCIRLPREAKLLKQEL